ncbi:tape measure protein [Atopobacter sp. AH10]|uniref:tape measure protein n=1 Tax=Atopobacter sp. AH10 TaxID=2315861 RepID=UPI001F448EF2|nr:tape measure protein [Atopobacter sp. AH10]
MTGELVESSVAWKTFDGNMRMIGKSSGEINKVKGSLQQFAQQSIYSASDMAKTYSQMAAIGTKNAEQLVKGMGGIAASSDNPKQAMKTLSQQMTQALTKPKMSWQDFKLMLEQSPAGMAAVAKQMGMSADDLVRKIQDGEIKSKDFAKALAEVGTNEHFSKMATTFKTTGEAMDGLKETLANKLQPAFEQLDSIGIKAISGIADRLEKVDFKPLVKGIDSAAKKIQSFARQASKAFGDFLKGFKASGAFQAFSSSMKSVGEAVKHVLSAFKPANASFRDVGKTVGNVAKSMANAVKGVADFVKGLKPGTIQGVAKAIAGLVIAFKGLKTAMKIKSLFDGFNPVKDGLSKLTGSAKQPQSILINVFKGITDVIKSAGEGLKTAFTGLGQGLSTAFQGLGKGLSTVLQGFGEMTQLINPAGVLALAGAIALVVASLALLATQAEGVKTILTAFGDAIATVVSALGDALSTVITALAEGFTAVSRAIGEAIAMIIPSLEPLMPYIERMVTAFITQLPLIIQAFNNLVSSIGTAMSQIISAIANGVSQIISALVPLVDAIGRNVDQILNAFGRLAGQVAGAISQVVSAVSSGVSQIIDAISRLVTSIAEGASRVIESFGDMALKVGESIEKVNNSIANMIDSVRGVIDEIGDTAKEVAEAFKMIADSCKGLSGANLLGIGAGFASMVVPLGGLALIDTAKIGTGLQQIGNALGSICLVSAIATDFTALKSALTGFPSLDTIASGLTAVGTALGNISGVSAFAMGMEQVKTSLSGLDSALAMSTTAVQSFNTSFTSAMSAISTGASSILSALSTSFTTIMSSIKSVVNSNLNSVKSTFTNSMSSIKQAVSSGFTQILSSARSGMSQFVSSIKSKSGACANAMRSCTNSAANAARGSIGTFRSIGAQIGNGLAQGMYSALGAITAAANAMVAQANRAARARAMIRSPSRLFANTVGKFIPRGVAMGIDKNTKYSNEAMESMISSMSKYKMKAEDLIGGGSNRVKSKFGLINGNRAVLGGSSNNSTYYQNYTLNANSSTSDDFFTPENMKRLIKEFAYYVNLEGGM